MKKQIIIGGSKSFSNIEYAKDFLRGNLRFMSLNYYINLEGDSREDGFEGVSSFYQPHLSEFEINGIKLNSDNLAGPILVRYDKDHLHIFCISAFYFKDISNTFETNILDNLNRPCETKLLTFGDITVLITNIDEFFNRVDLAAKKTKLSYKRKLVTYTSLDKFHGKMEEPGFVKDLNYENESEFRFALKGLSDGPFVLNIGDINDIAILMDTKNMGNFDEENLKEILEKIKNHNI